MLEISKMLTLSTDHLMDSTINTLDLKTCVNPVKDLGSLVFILKKNLDGLSIPQSINFSLRKSRCLRCLKI